MRHFAVLVFLWSASTSQAVERFCANDALDRKLLCVEQHSRENARRVEFHVANGYDFPVTISFRPFFDNMAADKAFPLVMTIPPLARKRAYEAWSVNPSARNAWNNQWEMRLGPNEPKHDDSHLYGFPFPDGKNFRLIQGYGGSFSHQGEFHYSLDWDMPIGTPVLAARAGMVIHAIDRFSGRSLDTSFKERTNTITLLHGDGTMAEYSHIATGSLQVTPGQRVREGDVLALSGDVGYSGGPHLHFRVFRLVRGTAYESLPIRFRDPRFSASSISLR